MRFLLPIILLSFPLFADYHPLMEKMVPRRARIANEVFVERMVSYQRIPAYVLENSQCIASLRVAKAGFFWGGEGSTGLVSCKTQEGWSVPSFFNVGGVTFGIQFGVQFLDSVLVFMSDYSRSFLYHPTVQVGVDLSFAAGPVGGGNSAGLIPKAHILSYDRAVGLFAGANIQGFVMAHAPERNRFVYGADYAPYKILSTPGRHAPYVVRGFVDSLNYYAPLH